MKITSLLEPQILTLGKATMVASLALFLFVNPSRAQADVIFPANNGFEVPDQGTPDYSSGGTNYGVGTAPTGTGVGWTFMGNSGVSANGSVFGTSNATNGNSDGTTSTVGQAGWIQANFANAEIAQDVAGFVAGTASITFSLEARPGAAGNPIDVLLDGTNFGTFTPTSSSSFTTFTTIDTDVTAGSHYLQFIGVGDTAGDDIMSFVDNVSINNAPDATPEPSTWAMLLGGFALLGGLLRSRQVTRLL
jgi:hypothetical protein